MMTTRHVLGSVNFNLNGTNFNKCSHKTDTERTAALCRGIKLKGLPCGPSNWCSIKTETSGRVKGLLPVTHTQVQYYINK